jgi:hypothetical protein
VDVYALLTTLVSIGLVGLAPVQITRSSSGFLHPVLRMRILAMGVQHVSLALLTLPDGMVPVILAALGAPAAPLRAAIRASYLEVS